MNKTEELLQELVDLKKKEIKQKQLSSILHFIFFTLPSLVLLLLTIYGSVILFQKAEEMINNLPETAQNYQEDFFDNIKSNLQP